MLSLLAFLVTTPLTFILLPLIIAWFLKNRTTKRILYGIAIVLTLVFTNTPLLKMAEDTESLVPKARLRQEGLYLLKYVQEHGNTYSLPRNLLIQFLESRN